MGGPGAEREAGRADGSAGRTGGTDRRDGSGDGSAGRFGGTDRRIGRYSSALIRRAHAASSPARRVRIFSRAPGTWREGFLALSLGF